MLFSIFFFLWDCAHCTEHLFPLNNIANINYALWIFKNKFLICRIGINVNNINSKELSIVNALPHCRSKDSPAIKKTPLPSWGWLQPSFLYCTAFSELCIHTGRSKSALSSHSICKKAQLVNQVNKITSKQRKEKPRRWPCLKIHFKNSLDGFI